MRNSAPPETLVVRASETLYSLSGWGRPAVPCPGGFSNRCPQPILLQRLAAAVVSWRAASCGFAARRTWW